MDNDDMQNLHLKSIRMQQQSLEMQAQALDTQREHMDIDHQGTAEQNKILERIAVALEKLAKKK